MKYFMTESDVSTRSIPLISRFSSLNILFIEYHNDTVILVLLYGSGNFIMNSSSMALKTKNEVS